MLTVHEPTAGSSTATSPEIEPVSIRLASDYYNSSTAKAGAAAAAAIAAKFSRMSTSKNAAAAAGDLGNEFSVRHKQQLEPEHSNDSALHLINLSQLEGAVVAIEEHTGGLYTPATPAGDTFWPCTFNLSKVIMGAGMMAVPKAFNMLGLIPGLTIMLLMACLVFFTLASLVSATAATGAGNSYGALVRRTVGSTADHALQIAVLLNCYVMNIVFVVVLGDILLGSAPEYAGLLPELLQYAGLELSPADCFWLQRPVVLGVLSALVLLPLSSMRSMEKLAIVNVVGVTSNGVFAALLLALAASAAATDALKLPRLLPNWSELGSSPLVIGMSLATIVPVLLNTNVCHQSLHPLMPLLRPYSVSRMQRLVATALGICNVLYLTVTICAGLVFGESLDADVLTNVNVAAMGPLIGPPAAVVMSCAVRVGYLMSIIGSYVLLSYPLRQCIGDLMLPGGQRTVLDYWQSLTVLLVGTIYCIACYLPSIWGALALIGATASTVQAFIVPGLVVLSVERAGKQGQAAVRHTAARQRWSQQQQYGEGIRTALLASGEDIEERQHTGSSNGAWGLRQHSAAVADGPRSAVGSCLRQCVAVFVILLGVGLFVNAMVDFAWSYSESKTGDNNTLLQQLRHAIAPLS